MNGEGTRQLVLHEAADSDTPLRTVAPAPEEAGQSAETVHTRPPADRVTALERRLAGNAA